MDKMYKPWKKELDDFDGAVDGLPALERGMRIWGSFAPAVPALFDAVIRERTAYKVTAGELRRWIDAQDEDPGEPHEFGKRLRATIEGARQLNGLIDALNRERAIAERAYPEMTGGSLRETAALAVAAPGQAGKAMSDGKDGAGAGGRSPELGGNQEDAAVTRSAPKRLS